MAIHVLASDTDPNNDIAPGTVAIGTGPSNGTVAVDPTTGIVTYTPSAVTGAPITYTVATTQGTCPTRPPCRSSSTSLRKPTTIPRRRSNKRPSP